MRINITIEDDGKREMTTAQTVPIEQAVPSTPADVAARAAAIGATSGGPAPVASIGGPGEAGAPPAFIPEAPGGTSTPPYDPSLVDDQAHATSAGAAPFGPELEPPVEVSDQG